MIPGQRMIEPPTEEIERITFELRPYVRQAGNDWRVPWTLSTRKLLDYLLVFIPEGEGEFQIEEKYFPVKGGDLIWIPPNTAHQMCGTSSQMHCLYVHFDLCYDPLRSHWDACIPGGTVDLNPWQEFMHPPVNDPLLKRLHGNVTLTQKAKMLELMTELCYEHSRYGNRAILKLSALMTLIIDLVIEEYRLCHENKRKGECSYVINDAALYIQEHIQNDLNVAFLARRCNLSESHFRKLFRQTFGRSPRAMHRKVRMHKACELLVYSDMNISEISDYLGFCSIHSFSRAFKDVISCSPSAYRN